MPASPAYQLGAAPLSPSGRATQVFIDLVKHFFPETFAVWVKLVRPVRCLGEGTKARSILLAVELA